jgi:hypothetical protein
MLLVMFESCSCGEERRLGVNLGSNLLIQTRELQLVLLEHHSTSWECPTSVKQTLYINSTGKAVLNK